MNLSDIAIWKIKIADFCIISGISKSEAINNAKYCFCLKKVEHENLLKMNIRNNF